MILVGRVVFNGSPNGCRGCLADPQRLKRGLTGDLPRENLLDYVLISIHFCNRVYGDFSTFFLNMRVTTLPIVYFFARALNSMIEATESFPLIF